MAQSVETLSLWADEQVRVADVLAAIDDIRRPEPMPPTRTSVLTLVVVARDPASVARAHDALHDLGGRHPARMLTLLVESDDVSSHGLDARVRLLGGTAQGRAVWFEAVELRVRGPVTGHLDSLIEPFTLPDLPVVVWFVDGLPEPDDPLLRAADVLLVDARDFGDTACFSTLANLLERPLVDLSWHRLRPWRELLAGLFEAREARPFATGVRSVRVVGRTGPRHLLAGWIGDRLRLPSSRIHLEGAEHVAIQIQAEAPDGRLARFEVVRTTDERVVRARASMPQGPTSEVAVPLVEATPGWGVASALSHLERDPVYEGALREAIALSNRAKQSP